MQCLADMKIRFANVGSFQIPSELSHSVERDKKCRRPESNGVRRIIYYKKGEIKASDSCDGVKLLSVGKD